MSEQIPIQETLPHQINTSPELNVNDLIDGRFAVLPNPFRGTITELEETKTSHLYLAQDIASADRKDVAVKLHTSTEAHDYVRHERERILLETIHHPHIIPVVATGIHYFEDDTEAPYIATEYIHDGDLRRQRVENEQQARLVLHCLIDAADALGELHRQGLVHRDFKPDNIFHDGERAYLGDLGIAAPIHEQDTPEPLIHSVASDAISSLTATESGKIVGSPAYMTQERLYGLPALPEDDVFSLGVTAFQEFANRYPWESPTEHTAEGLIKAMKKGPISNAHVPNYVNPEVVEAIYACLDERAENRPTVEEFMHIGRVALAA